MSNKSVQNGISKETIHITDDLYVHIVSNGSGKTITSEQKSFYNESYGKTIFTTMDEKGNELNRTFDGDEAARASVKNLEK